MDLSLDEIHALQKRSDYFGFVDTPYGKIFLGGNDDGIALRYYHGIPYEPETLKKWHELCASAKNVVDVGAHTGIYTLAAYHAGAKIVYSVEPNERNSNRMILNLRANRRSIYGCVVGALWDKDNVGTFVMSEHPYYHTTAGRIDGRVPKPTTSPVRTHRLDTLLPNADIAAIKIDIEGNVGKVLDGMPEILKRGPALIIEREGGVETLLAKYGYRCIEELDERNVFFVKENVVAAAGYPGESQKEISEKELAHGHSAR